MVGMWSGLPALGWFAASSLLLQGAVHAVVNPRWPFRDSRNVLRRAGAGVVVVALITALAVHHILNQAGAAQHVLTGCTPSGYEGATECLMGTVALHDACTACEVCCFTDEEQDRGAVLQEDGILSSVVRALPLRRCPRPEHTVDQLGVLIFGGGYVSPFSAGDGSPTARVAGLVAIVALFFAYLGPLVAIVWDAILHLRSQVGDGARTTGDEPGKVPGMLQPIAEGEQPLWEKLLAASVENMTTNDMVQFWRVIVVVRPDAQGPLPPWLSFAPAWYVSNVSPGAKFYIMMFLFCIGTDH